MNKEHRQPPKGRNTREWILCQRENLYYQPYWFSHLGSVRLSLDFRLQDGKVRKLRCLSKPLSLQQHVTAAKERAQRPTFTSQHESELSQDTDSLKDKRVRILAPFPKARGSESPCPFVLSLEDWQEKRLSACLPEKKRLFCPSSRSCLYTRIHMATGPIPVWPDFWGGKRERKEKNIYIIS